VSSRACLLSSSVTGPRAGINANDGFGGGDEIGHNLVFSTCRECVHLMFLLLSSSSSSLLLFVVPDWNPDLEYIGVCTPVMPRAS